MSVLLIAEHNNKELKPFTLNAVTAASQMDTDLHAVIIGHNCEDAAKKLSELPLVKKSVSSRSSPLRKLRCRKFCTRNCQVGRKLLSYCMFSKYFW